MLPRRLHRSAGTRRPAAWPPPPNSPGPPLLFSAVSLPGPALLALLLVTPLAGASAAQPLLLGCRLADADQLLPWAAFSALGGSAGCAELCSQQAALLAVVSSRWCFCLNQPPSAAELTANCTGAAPPGLELLHVYSLNEATTTIDDTPSRSSLTPSYSRRSLSSELALGALRLDYIRCALSSGESTDPLQRVDACVHSCSAQFSDGFMALGPGTAEQYECHCAAADTFGVSLDDSTCDQHCWRFGEEMKDTMCGGELPDGSKGLTVYRLVDDNPGSTPTPVTTRRSTGHSPSASGFTDSTCPFRGYLISGSCYRVEPVGGSQTYQDVEDACSETPPENEWRPWAVETKEELENVYNGLQIQGYLDVATSGVVKSVQSTVVEWDGWDETADWVVAETTGTPQPNDVIVWGGVQDGFEQTTLTYYRPDQLPTSSLATICELPLPGSTTSTPESTTSPPTTTDLTSTSTDSSTASSTSTSSTTSPSSSTSTPFTTSTPLTESTSVITSTSFPTTPPTTPEPGPETPDEVINDLIDDLNNKTSSSNITDTDVIDTVDQLDDILEAQINMSSALPPEERLDSDKQFTLDMVQLVDTLLSATDAWSNMAQSQREETSRKLMNSTEAAGFLLANSTAAAGSDDVIETDETSLVLSASSVSRTYGGGFRFPLSPDSPFWIQLPEGYASQTTQLEGDRVPQVGLLYRAEVMELILAPSNNSMHDAGKRLNSPVLGFSLGGPDRRVRLPTPGARLHLPYTLTEREPPRREVWRHLHPAEEPSAVRGTAVCAYWNETLSEWSTDGCRREESLSSKQHASCVCSHLTSFAVLMDYHEYVGTPQSLNILTWVLGSLSFIGLVITWIVFTCNRSLHCTRTTITRHLCGTYAIGLLLLLTVMDRRLVYLQPGACTAAGMAIHYAFLAVFGWTLVEGVHLYKVLRHVFEPKSNSMTRYYMYGYLLPALILIITTTVALAVDQYAYVRDEFCWLTVPYFIWFYNGPIAIVLIMNLFVLILAYRSAAALKVNQLRAKKEKMKRWLKGWFSLSCLLGVQWAIGYIYVDGSNVFDYVFTALNCSQGLLIFIFHCVLREKPRQALLGRFSTSKRSTMMNSVYGQMVIGERKKHDYRQSRMSHDTCVTTLSNSASPANSESPDSSPASERSSSSSQGSSDGSKGAVRPTSMKAHRPLSRGGFADSKRASSLKGRVNLAFQPDEPWAPLPEISEETDSAASPRHEPAPHRNRGSRVRLASHADTAEIYRPRLAGRSHSVATLRHGRAH